MTRLDQVSATKPAAVVACFLNDMSAVAQRTFPAWQRRLADGIADVAPEGSALYDQIVNHQPLDDFYFAAVVGVGSSKIRRHLPANDASSMLAELAAQVDRAAGRPDRAVSDLVFSMLGRIELESGVELMTMPYDKAVQIILQRIGIEQHETTKNLVDDFVFRHGLGEPLARGIPEWWKSYAAQVKHSSPDAKQPLAQQIF